MLKGFWHDDPDLLEIVPVSNLMGYHHAGVSSIYIYLLAI